MLKKDVVLVTTTLTKNCLNDYRFNLALQMCWNARDHDYPVIVVDGSPDSKAGDRLTAMGALVETPKEPGMGPSRRQTIRAGLQTSAKAIGWLEPEKEDFIRHLRKCLKLIEQGADVVVPWRNRLYQDYPAYQALSEGRANAEIAEVTKMNLDLMCGPRIFSRRAAELFASYQGRSRVDPSVLYDDNWGILFVPVLWAKVDGMKIVSCPIDYVHPDVQTFIEENDESMDRKRDIQRTALVAAMRQEAKLLGMI